MHTTGSGAEALRMLDGGGVDPVVLDLGLPDVDGLEILTVARRQREVPVVVLTARSQIEDRIDGLRAGADDYVTKPFSPTELVVALSSVAILTAAALVGTAQGLNNAQQNDRRETAARTAEAAAVAYQRAGGWAGADLTAASAIADATGAGLVVRDDDGQMVWPGQGMGPGMNRTHAAATAPVVDARVITGGQTVGDVRLAFTTIATGGRAVAWSWVLGAAGLRADTDLTVALPYTPTRTGCTRP